MVRGLIDVEEDATTWMRRRQYPRSYSMENSKIVRLIGFLLIISMCGTLFFFYGYFNPPSVESIYNNQAYVTLVTSDSYVIGAKVLGFSLKQTNTTRKMIALVTETVSDDKITELKSVGFQIKRVNGILVKDSNALSGDAKRWLTTYTKLRVWELPLRKVIFLEADCLVVKNIDELFQIEEFGAAPECCDRFNSGVFVTEPSITTFNDMLSKVPTLYTYDGADQGFLNEYFTSWKLLSFYYNALQNHWINDRNAWVMERLKVIHYVKYKPWEIQPETNPQVNDLHQIWWRYYNQLNNLH